MDLLRHISYPAIVSFGNTVTANFSIEETTNVLTQLAKACQRQSCHESKLASQETHSIPARTLVSTEAIQIRQTVTY